MILEWNSEDKRRKEQLDDARKASPAKITEKMERKENCKWCKFL